MVLDPEPQAFDGIEFRTVRQQVMQGDVGRDVEVFGQMPAGLIQGPGSRVGPAQHVQIDVKHLGIGGGCDHAHRLSRLRIDRPIEPYPLVLGLPYGGRPRAAFGPDPRQGPLLTEATFVLEPCFNGSSGVFLLNVLIKRGKACFQAS